MLKTSRSIHEPKRHHCILKQALVGQERSFVLIPFFYAQLVVCRGQVNQRKVPSLAEGIQQVSYTRQWKHIKARVAVQCPEIHAHPQFTSFLSHKQDWGSIRRHQRANPTLLQQLCHLLFDLSLLNPR